ncbi:MAG: A/G-specific adenine glycosylase [Caulobacteraceae bacterium]|nr:A/G-specific adenine glycosylase [Caulobacteraceae bacterium]
MRDVPAFRRKLLDWYDAQGRDLAWRVGPRDQARGFRADPYRVWLSEVMLQQTTVPHATPYFLRFTTVWPTVRDLAAADDGEVMAAWAGLGYYARARNLLACARAVVERHGGDFPDTEAELLGLPGVGAYTAAAVAAIAFDRPANVVDGNVERVVSRLYAVETPSPASKTELKSLAARLVEADRPGDWAQALMDLGATVCRPRGPLCDRCPVAPDCAAFARGDQDSFPRKAPKAARPRRHGVAWLIEDAGRIVLIRRPAKGLLGGMLGLPTSEWRAQPFSDEEAVALAPVAGPWRDQGVIEHVFTHFALSLRVYRAKAVAPRGSLLGEPDDLGALPSVFLKAARLGLKAPGSG